ncbi:MAG: lipopolysaccharide kinase InaA family protein [Pseudomonadota bacterium]
MATERINDMKNNNIANFLQEFSWSSLKVGNRVTVAPFQLALTDSKDTLFCHEIIRVIPGKRLVAFGTYAGKPVVAKLFYEPGNAVRHARREYTGIKALLDNGVLTPQLYYHGKAKDGKVQVLIFEKITNAQNLAAIWENRSSIKELLPLLQALMIELATHHVLGILQHDLHFKNFLVKRKNIYTIDGGDLQVFYKPLTKKDSLDNLGLFFSQLGVGTEELQKALFQVYAESRSFLVKKQDLAYLTAAQEKWTAIRWEQFSKKIFRSCTAFVRKGNLTSVSMYDRDYESAELLQLLKAPEAIFTSPDTEILKSGRSATVVKIKLDDKYFVLKRYNMKNALHLLRRCLRPTRAANSWRLAQRLRLMGVSTAKPAAFIEKRFLGLRGKSYLLTEYIEGEHAGDFFALHQNEDAHSLFVAQQIIALFENLARLRITHGDLKMTNILIARQLKPILIDLDGMYEHKNIFGFKRTFHREIKRFMVNWRGNPTVYNMFELLVQEIYRRMGVNA